jgi:hypothetical protein
LVGGKLKFVFHVGPHKTGTTAIQVSLRDNRKSLLESKVFIPETSLVNHGHHEIPWALLGWDLRLLGANSKEVDLELYLERVIAEALLAECDTIVFSSEDFSLLDDKDWSHLLVTIQNLVRMGTQVDFRILFFYREIDDAVRSQYKTLVLLGLDLKFEKVQEKLRVHFDNVYRFLEDLPNRISTKVETRRFNYQSKGHTNLFWAYFLPGLKISELENNSVKLNTGYSDESIELFRKANILDSISFDIDFLLHWPSFHSLSSNSRVAARRKELFPSHEAQLIGTDELLRQRDKYRSERDELLSERDQLRFDLDLVYNSRSWALTRPVRFVANYFRSFRHNGKAP